MSTIVKICGLTTADTLEAAVEAGADMVGFVFFPPSPRNLGFDEMVDSCAMFERQFAHYRAERIIA